MRNKTHSNHQRNSKGFKEPCTQNWGHRRNIFLSTNFCTKYAAVSQVGSTGKCLAVASPQPVGALVPGEFSKLATQLLT